jgi:ATP-dependent RNA helicase DeaD
VEKKRANSFYDSLHKTLEEGKYERQDALIGRLLDQGFVATDIASALIHLFGDEDTKPIEPIRQQRPAPARRKDASLPEHHESPERGRHPESYERRSATTGTGLKADRESGAVSHEPGMVRLTLGVGRDHGVQPGDVLGVIVGVTKLPKETVGVIRLQTKQTFVDVAEENADFIVSKLNGIEFKGRKLWCKRALKGKIEAA